MLPAILVMLREGLEISLPLAIVLAYLKRTDKFYLSGHEWQGSIYTVIASLASIGILLIFDLMLRANQEIFVGAARLFAAGMLTWMILWMKNEARYIRTNLEANMQQSVVRTSTLGLTTLVFLVVGRKGLVTVSYLFNTSMTESPMETTVGGIFGLALAIVFAGFLYRSSRIFKIDLFFNVTSVLLVLFAAGLIIHGLHDLQATGILLVLVEHVWDVNHILNDQSALGSILSGLFGYNGNPSLLEVVAYIMYLILGLTFFSYRFKKEMRLTSILGPRLWAKPKR